MILIIFLLIIVGPFCARTAVMLKLAFLSLQLSMEKKKGPNINLAYCTVINVIITQLDILVVILDDYMISHGKHGDEEKDFVQNYMTPKLQALVAVLKNEK